MGIANGAEANVAAASLIEIAADVYNVRAENLGGADAIDINLWLPFRGWLFLTHSNVTC